MKGLILILMLLILAGCSKAPITDTTDVQTNDPFEKFAIPDGVVPTEAEDCISVGPFCLPKSSLHVVAKTTDGRLIYGFIEPKK